MVILHMDFRTTDMETTAMAEILETEEAGDIHTEEITEEWEAVDTREAMAVDIREAVVMAVIVSE